MSPYNFDVLVDWLFHLRQDEIGPKAYLVPCDGIKLWTAFAHDAFIILLDYRVSHSILAPNDPKFDTGLHKLVHGKKGARRRYRHRHIS